jgi:uncharacterized membrane protein YfcA
LTWPLSALETAWCALALVAGYAVRGVAGFGSGVVATPLLTFVLPLSVTAPMITVIGFFVSVRQALHDWRLIQWQFVTVFIPGSLVGVALGLYVFKAVDQVWLARWLGAYILLYAFYSLFGHRVLRRTLTLPPWLIHPVSALGALVATIFGGLAGPIYVTYFDALNLSKSVFRVTVSTTLLATEAFAAPTPAPRAPRRSRPSSRVLQSSLLSSLSYQFAPLIATPVSGSNK